MLTPITAEHLAALGVDSHTANRQGAAFAQLLPAYGIDTPERQAHFLGQVLHESGKLKHVRENLNYSAERLWQIFPRHFSDQAKANSYARDPERIANRVYAKRIGNGDEASGDGWRFRGRGYIQVTGRYNYTEFSQWLHHDDRLLDQPDLVASAYPLLSALWFWETRGLNTHADANDIERLTRAINGGTNGIDDRRQLASNAAELLHARAIA